MKCDDLYERLYLYEQLKTLNDLHAMMAQLPPEIHEQVVLDMLEVESRLHGIIRKQYDAS